MLQRGPFTFTLGLNEVISGWNEGLRDMCLGEQRELVIPSELAYGGNGVPSKIPEGASLTFFVDLVSIDTNGSGL